MNNLDYIKVMIYNYCVHCQVSALAPLALLLVLEARCTHFSIAHFSNIVCCGVVHPSDCYHTAHIIYDNLVTCYKDVSEHYRDCNGNSSAHVQGRRQLDLVLWLHTVPIMIIYTRTRNTGRFKGYFLSVHMAN